MGLALTGRRTRRANLLPADLSLTPVTSLSMLLGTHSLAAFKQLKLFLVYICELLFLSVFIFQFIYY
ncbi:hypothetical protein D6K36_06565 [Salmonella enterica subsp. enterica]|nr:hypothetical protein [Salmonella enterica subsp. enterica]